MINLIEFWNKKMKKVSEYHKLPAVSGGITGNLVKMLLICGILPILILSALFFNTHLTEQKRSIREIQKEVAGQISSEIGGFLSKVSGRLQVFVNLSPIENITGMDFPMLANTLFNQGLEFSTMSVVDSAGNELCNISRHTRSRSTPGSNKTSTELFRDTMQGKIFIGGLEISEFTGFPLLHIAFPLTDRQGKIKGMIDVGTDFTRMWQLISEQSLGKYRYAYIVDRTGELIAHPKIFSGLTAKELVQVEGVKNFLDGHFGVFDYEGIDKNRVIGAVTNIPFTGWGVIVEQSTSTAFRELYRFSIILCAVLIITAVSAWGFGIRFSSARIVQPIRRLQKEANIIASGNYTRKLSIDRNDELGDLAKAFDEMTTKIGKANAILEQEVSERRQTEYELRQEVAKRKRIQQALLISEQRFRSLVESTNDWIWETDPNGVYTYASPKVKDLLGILPEKVIGKTAFDFMPKDEANRVRKIFMEKASTKEPFGHLENANIHTSGQIVILESNAVPIINDDGTLMGYRGIDRDITQRKETEKALTEAYNIINKSPSIAFLWKNEEGWPVEFVTENVEELLGYTADDFLSGKISYVDVVHPEDLDRVAKEVSEFSSMEERKRFVHEPYRIISKDNTSKWVQDSTFIKRDEQGQITHYNGIVYDITKRKEAEVELAKYREQLEELVQDRTIKLEMAQKQLLKKERLSVLGQLTATVSHELRNPLGVIRSSSYYLQKRYKGQDEKIKKHVSRIEDQVEICDSIVGDLLEYTRGRHSQMVKGEINPWLEQVIDEIPEVEGVKIEKVLAAYLPKVHFDKEKMRRVVVNLMDNSLQSIKERRQMENNVSYRPKIEVSSNSNDDSIIIMIKDNGIGMDEETMERAFEPLFTTRARGTGLGLANVEKIIQEHNGAVLLESKPHEETTVIITIPAFAKE
jgi:PAS domain S-box-containing protein